MTTFEVNQTWEVIFTENNQIFGIDTIHTIINSLRKTLDLSKNQISKV